MATPRRPLGPISGNLTRGKDTSPYVRGRIVEARDGGMKVLAIMAKFQVSRAVVRHTLEMAVHRTDGVSLAKPGRPIKYTAADYRLLLRIIQAYPKYSHQKLRNETGLTFCNSTIDRELVKHHIDHWVCKRHPLLTQVNVDKRLKWCKERVGWTSEKWGLVMWSDECSVERGAGKDTTWCFRTLEQKWKPEYIETYHCGKGIRVMVWAAFWDDGRTGAYLMDRDFESKKHRYSANSYLEVLDSEVASNYPGPGYIFMQDNASIHTAKKVKEWFRIQHINTFWWPPYSPDLNPIEHAWWELKKRLYKMFPDIANCMGKSEADIERLGSAIQAAWDTIPKEFFDKLYQSMPHRVAACIKAKGWHTKY